MQSVGHVQDIKDAEAAAHVELLINPIGLIQKSVIVLFENLYVKAFKQFVRSVQPDGDVCTFSTTMKK